MQSNVKFQAILRVFHRPLGFRRGSDSVHPRGRGRGQSCSEHVQRKGPGQNQHGNVFGPEISAQQWPDNTDRKKNKTYMAGGEILLMIMIVPGLKSSSARMSESASRDRCPPDSSARVSFHTEPNATLTWSRKHEIRLTLRLRIRGAGTGFGIIYGQGVLVFATDDA